MVIPNIPSLEIVLIVYVKYVLDVIEPKREQFMNIHI